MDSNRSRYDRVTSETTLDCCLDMITVIHMTFPGHGVEHSSGYRDVEGEFVVSSWKLKGVECFGGPD